MRAKAGHGQRAAGGGEDRSSLVQSCRFGQRDGARISLRRDFADLGLELILRDHQHHRSWPAVQRAANCGPDKIDQPLGPGNRARPLHDRRHKGKLFVIERGRRFGRAGGRRSDQNHHWRSGGKGNRQPADGVGQALIAHDQRDPDPFGALIGKHPRIAVGAADRAAFVPVRQDRHPSPVERVEQIAVRGPGQREYASHALRHHQRGNGLSSVHDTPPFIWPGSFPVRARATRKLPARART